MLEGGDSSASLEPFVGPNSILILKGEPTSPAPAMLPPFHGDALRRWTSTIAAATGARHLGAEKPLKALPRMQAITLEVIGA